MPAAELPHSEELIAFRQQLLEIFINPCDSLDDDGDSRLCSEKDVPVNRSAAMTQNLTPLQQQSGKHGGSLLQEEVTHDSHGEFLPLVPASLSKLRYAMP